MDLGLAHTRGISRAKFLDRTRDRVTGKIKTLTTQTTWMRANFHLLQEQLALFKYFTREFL